MAQKLITSLKQSASRLAVNRASILIISLWSACLLSVFAVILSSGVMQKITLVERFDERDRLRLIAEAGVNRAICELLDLEEEGNAFYALKDKWSNDTGAFKDVDIGGGTFNVCYDYADDKTGAMQTRWGLIDEERKININTIDLSPLTRLFGVLLDLDEAQAQELAASIIDWRDKDSGSSIPSQGAEDYYYRGLPYPYEAKDSDFETLNEVLLVKGMAKDIFEKIKDYITIYGSGKININTASRPVIIALGVNEGIADNILSYRAGKDEITGTSDDNVFETTSDIVPKLDQIYHFNDNDKSQLSAVIEQYVVTNSEYFTIRSLAKLNAKRNIDVVTCAVSKNGKVLYWQES